MDFKRIFFWSSFREALQKEQSSLRGGKVLYTEKNYAVVPDGDEKL